ncbi:cell envelope integrity protein TolA [Rhodovulum steppense]|uniref:Outer membrane transport energization protein TonB n=1 Tax=Rhodovulum steppense TaxID=540251 RepID=A0A4R1YUH8_9RHOB|nr:TonB family protein [Rhodovulum steppense]TCM84526.1 outer membrane transport energization protein TonB [Rhodovulum steppense]
MIPSSQLGRGAALGFAIAAHGALALVLVPQDAIEIAGSAGATEARLGTSFADMAAGTLSAMATHQVVEAVTPSETVPPVPHKTLAPLPAETAPLAAPELMAALSPGIVSAADHGESTRPAPRPVPERIEARDPPRPETRPEDKPRREARATPRGNAERDASAGQESGRPQAQATTSGQAGRAAEVGNAAVSNYPGLVMRKLARVPRPRVNSHGAAVVAFRIAENGGLAGASLAQSSGSASLDQAALRLVQRAAPFPAPPSGAQRSFSIRIEGR